MPSPTIRIAVFAVAALASGAALAQDLPEFSFAEACRIDGTSAVLRLVYQGGACETTVDLEPRVELDGPGALVIVPTKSTAEICTMQMVPNHVQKTIGITPDTTELAITLLNTQLEPQGQQTIPVLTDGVDCAAKGEGP